MAVLLAGVSVVIGVMIWLAIGASSSLSTAREVCHRRVRADRSLSPDAAFTDSEARATGDAIVVRGVVRVASNPSVQYSCTVRTGTASSFDVRVVIDSVP